MKRNLSEIFTIEISIYLQFASEVHFQKEQKDVILYTPEDGLSEFDCSLTLKHSK